MLDVYIACLSNAVLHRRAALQLELAVGLCVAHDNAHDEAFGRVTLVSVYANAGYQCLSTDGADYKTINRRVNNAFLLYNKLGDEAVKRAVRGNAGHRRIEAVQAMIEPLQLYSMDDVLAFCGRPRASQARVVTPAAGAPAPARRAADRPEVRHIKTAHIDVPLPPEATRAEIMEVATELLRIANTFDNGKVAGPRTGRRRPGRSRRDELVHH
jgi:hypothetical protein